MTLPMSVKTEPDGFFKAESVIDARGKCAEIRSREEEMEVSLVINHALMPEGISAQQRKMGIAILQEMYTKALVFLGHTASSRLLPGMVVEVTRTTDPVDKPRYIGVVDEVNGDRVTLRTLTESAVEQVLEISRSEYDILQNPQYMGIDGLKALVLQGIFLPPTLKHAQRVLQQAANRDLEEARVTYASGRNVADVAAIANIRDVERWPNAPKTPVENAWTVLLGGAVATKATVISMEQEGGELQILVHARGEKIPYHASHGSSNRDLYAHVKLVAKMDLESKETQKGKFSSGFFLQDVTCVVETFFRNDGPLEGLAIALVY